MGMPVHLLATRATAVMLEKSSCGCTPWVYRFSAMVTMSMLPQRSPLPKQAAFHALGARHHCQLRGGHAGAPVVVGAYRQHHVLARAQVAAHPLDLVGKHVGRGVFHRGGQVDDDGAAGPGVPRGNGGLAGFERDMQLGGAEGFGRILQRPLRSGRASVSCLR